MRSSKDRIGRLVTVLALVALAAGCHLRKRTPDPPDDDTPTEDTPSADTPASPGHAHPVAPAHAAYFKNATSVPAKLAAKIGGPVRVIELVVYPDYVIAEVQDPRKHGNVDRFTLRDGVVGDGDPVRLVGDLKSARDVDAVVQDLASVDFAILPRMVKETRAHLRIEDGKVTHAILDARRVFHKDVTWRVYVSSARKDGSVEFDLAGHVKKVFN